MLWSWSSTTANDRSISHLGSLSLVGLLNLGLDLIFLDAAVPSEATSVVADIGDVISWFDGSGDCSLANLGA